MTTTELKTNFHKLIDNIDNDEVLLKFYELLAKTNEIREGSLWARLNPEEQQELIMIEQDSHSEDNLIPHSQMINRHKKWL